ncbi:hypothetical protein P280DRAFT_467320 [Massarina eburnea CBS 473.64]|uniref:Uncharacterized protein n=1 Tax=Massarina eburnea CBS 473.64 TaxID=1395130 RepID=A0A6A6S7R3_9PLEO|nr:hypothetical protein P280DRAFT_467320 [Massarina eburnea CBS 473.64]
MKGAASTDTLFLDLLKSTLLFTRFRFMYVPFTMLFASSLLRSYMRQACPLARHEVFVGKKVFAQ